MSSDRVQTSRASEEGGAGAPPAAGLRGFNRIGCVLLPLVLVAVVWVSYHFSARSAERALEAEIERLAAAGIIVPVEDLIPKVPPGERNAADVYEQAFAAFVPPSPDDSELLRSDPWDVPERLAAARRLVAQNDVYFALLDEAASLPYCAWPVDWTRPWDASSTTIPRYTKLRTAAEWQWWRTQLLLAEGDEDGALHCAAAPLRSASHLQAEPSGTSHVYARVAQAQAGSTIGTVLSSADPSVATCRDLFDLLAGIDNVGTSVRALKGDLTTWALPQMQNIHDSKTLSGQPRGLVELLDDPDLPWQDRVAVRGVALLGNLVISEDIIHYLRYREKVIRAYSLPWPESRSVLREAAVEFEAAPFVQSLVSRRMIDTELTLTGLVFRDRCTALLGAAQVGLAAAAYRAEHGDYPDSLDELAAAGWNLPADPFGGGPLHYRREASGFVVWSVGPDLADQRAAVEYTGHPMSLADGAYDIVFRCERSQQAGAVGSSP